MTVYQSKTDPMQIFIRLPESEQTATECECNCKQPGCTDKWDTLTVWLGDKKNPKAWLVHFPNLEISQTVNRVN